MPELNAIHITIFGVLTLVGTVLGWVIRGKRAAHEKAVATTGWQEQLNAQSKEHDRLTEQNKDLMGQISQYLASNKDAKNRAAELADVVQEANKRRDQLQSEIKDIRKSLEISLNERDQLQSDISSKTAGIQDAEAKDARIKKLQTSLEGWQTRVPPLVEKFKQKNEEATRLELELVSARERIVELEASLETGATVIESVCDPDELTDGRDASNDAADDSKTELMSDEHDEYVVEVLGPSEDDVDTDNDPYPVENNIDADESESPVNDRHDNLKEIKGIGPAIEKTLNELGVRSFHQIADMSEYDIDRIAKHLKGFRSRIYREDWIGQARDLGDQDSGG